jgi:Thioredoxin like C-terminal domain
MGGIVHFLRAGRLPAPEIDAADWAGDALPLGPLRGRVVLLDFFSYGDPSSVLTLDRIRGLGEHYRDSGLVVLGLHVPAYAFERVPSDARREIWRLGIPHPVALDRDFGVFRRYGLANLPARVLVDAAGMLRGWTEGPGQFEALELAIRTLLREAAPDRELPARHEPSDDLPRSGALRYLATREIRFGEFGVGFGPPEGPTGTEGAGGGEQEGAAAPPAGGTREFEMPELRSEGRAYLDGRWTLGPEGITCADEEGGVAVVFEGAGVNAVLSPGEGDDESVVVSVTMDGRGVDPDVAGADVEVRDGGVSEVAVARGRVYELVAGADFAMHNLDLRVRGRGCTLHLLTFGTREVPEAS